MDEEKSASVSLHFFPTDLSIKARNWWQFGNFSWSIGWKAEMHEAWKCRLNSFPFSIIRLLEMLKCLTFCLIQFCCLLATAGWCTSLNKMHHDLSEGKVLSLHKSSFSFLFLRQLLRRSPPPSWLLVRKEEIKQQIFDRNLCLLLSLFFFWVWKPL